MTPEPRPDPGARHCMARRQGTSIWPFAIVLGVVLLLLWPLQAILAGMLVAMAFVVAGASHHWTNRHVADRAHRRAVDHRVREFSYAALAVGLVLIVVWPLTMVIATLALALVVSLAWGLEVWAERETITSMRAEDPSMARELAAPVPEAPVAPRTASRMTRPRRVAQPARRTTSSSSRPSRSGRRHRQSSGVRTRG